MALPRDLFDLLAILNKKTRDLVDSHARRTHSVCKKSLRAEIYSSFTKKQLAPPHLIQPKYL